MTYPEEFHYPEQSAPIREYDTPAAFSGLEEMRLGDAVRIRNMGVAGNLSGNGIGDNSVSITVEPSRGRSFTTGREYDFERWRGGTITTIVALAEPHYSCGPDGKMTRCNFGTLSKVPPGNDHGGKMAFTPLHPGIHHDIKGEDGTVVGIFGINTDGSLDVVRNSEAAGSVVRLVGLQTRAGVYESRPALSKARGSIQLILSNTIQCVDTDMPHFEEENPPQVDPGLMVAEIDPVTRQTVLRTSLRPIRVPAGTLQRLESETQRLLNERAQSAQEDPSSQVRHRTR